MVHACVLLRKSACELYGVAERRGKAGSVFVRTVYVVDDDAGIRTSSAFFLQSVGMQPRVFENGQAFMAAATDLTPGCVLLDVRMPAMDGFEVIERLNDRRAELPVVVMTGHGDVLTAVRAMKVGAVDFLEKPFAEAMVLDILNRLFATLDEAVAADSRRHHAEERMKHLTDREAEVLHGLIAGRSNKVLAYDLGISVRTIEMHRAGMMNHLGVRTFAEALRLAFEAGAVGGATDCRPTAAGG